MATPSNAEFSDIVISPDVATDSNAKRYEVNLDGISVIVSAPADAFDREVTLKARRLSKDEIDNNINPEDGDDYIGNTASSNMIETVAAFDESIEETKEVIEEIGESVADSEQISENINYLDDAVIGNDESESETYPEDSISLDIHFEDENQLEIEPLTTVYVNIKIDNDMLPPGAKPEDTEVYHIKDDNSVTKIEDIALTEDKEDNSITTNFSTDGFSTFTLIWGGKFKVNIKYVDTNGNEIASDLNQLSIYRDHNGYFNNSNDKITPKQLDTGIPGMKYKYARVRMSNGTVVDNVIQIERETSLIKGMRYTVDGTNWVVFGPNEMQFLELVYEPENATNTRRGKVRISKSKTVEDPDKDGIYDLTLEINNLTGSTTDKANLDVLFLVDTSSSMNRRIRVGDDPKMNVVHNSLRRFLNQNYLDSNMYNVNYALVGIDADPTVYQNWTANKSSIISNYPWAASGQSRINYEKGFVKANELFRNGRSDALKMLIFLTDGDPTYYTNHNTGHNEGFLIDRYSPMAMLHGQFALYAIDLDYFFSIGLGDTNDYKHLKALTNSNDNDSPIKGYRGITLPANGVEVGSSPYSADSLENLMDQYRYIISVMNSITVSNVSIEDKLSQYAMIAKNSSGQLYPLEIEVIGGTGLVTGQHISSNTYRLISTLKNPQSDLVANYNDATKTISLRFPPNYVLEKGYKYRIKAKIKTTPLAEATYASTGQFQKHSNGSNVVGDSGTGSKSSNQKGFYSNDTAKVSYSYKGNDVIDYFKKPVIQPYIKPVPTGVAFDISYALIFIIMSILSIGIFGFNRRKRC
ncbi:VWA domain-containing protein [Lachnoanaerobaculum umeaense]|uniref:VWA domain-containing protein n=1 Tax=Lachnoanaerobaculum umeaense TaxID=617123 RepID=A0A385Q397_9FIRM|nr:VWA domain-containing protein [Lachnoanaerobaculum umeaense]